MTRRSCSRAVAVATAVLVWVAAGCLPGSDLPVPEALRGVWTTDDPRYEGRALHILADSVRFDTGDGGYAVHRIRSLEAGPGEGDGTRYTIRYVVPGGRATLSFQRFVRNGSGVLVLDGRPGMTWRRGDPATDGPPDVEASGAPPRRR